MHAAAERTSICANDEQAAAVLDIHAQPSDSAQALEIAFHMSGVLAYLEYYNT